MNAAGQVIGSSDDEHHRSDGNESDGSMINLNEDLKPIGYYIKDRERMLHEMFRCVRGHKLQAILPDVLKVTLIKSSAVVHDRNLWSREDFIGSTLRRISRHLFFFIIDLHSHEHVRLMIDPCFR